MKILKKLKFILVFIVYISPINFLYAQSSGDIISNIIIEGNQRVEQDTIYSYLNINNGDFFDIDKLNNSLKNLYSTDIKYKMMSKEFYHYIVMKEYYFRL